MWVNNKNLNCCIYFKDLNSYLKNYTYLVKKRKPKHKIKKGMAMRGIERKCAAETTKIVEKVKTINTLYHFRFSYTRICFHLSE